MDVINLVIHLKKEKMWNPIHKFGLTDKEKDTIVEELWKKTLEESTRSCPDCSVKPGQSHEFNCDVARCTKCEGQRLQCDCELEKEEVWDGTWPGSKECYEQKLVCCWKDTKEWTWDLNELAMRN